MVIGYGSKKRQLILNSGEVIPYVQIFFPEIGVTLVGSVAHTGRKKIKAHFVSVWAVEQACAFILFFSPTVQGLIQRSKVQISILLVYCTSKD